MNSRPVQPVAPSGMAILFTYVCPHCGQQNYIPEPVQPESCRCGRCAQPFPIIPVDRRTLHYLRIMFDNGRAAADIDFI